MKHRDFIWYFAVFAFVLWMLYWSIESSAHIRCTEGRQYMREVECEK